MRRSFALWYACLLEPLSRQHLPPRLNELADLMPNGAETIADIGTDHGLLAFAMAKRRPYANVIGVDASVSALKQGAETLPKLSNLNFLHGDGLDAVGHPVEGACIAGMGVHTMIEILQPNKLVDMDCRNLVLQPTGSRPRLLAFLYQHLTHANWHLAAESMCFTTGRWYLTSLWQRNETLYDSTCIPGVRLDTDGDDHVRRWVAHHCNWIRSDREAGSAPTESEKHWMEFFCSR